MLAIPAVTSNIETDSEKWGYAFVGAAIDGLLRNLEGEAAIEAYPDFRERRERANELLLELVGQQPQLFYVRRMGSGLEPGEEIWELTIATDENDTQLPARLENLGKTLGFRAAVPSNGSILRLLSCKLLPKATGQADNYALPYRLRLLPNHQHHIGIPLTALTRMATMPVCGEQVLAHEQLKAWEAFLGIEEKIAKARQFCVPFVGHNYGAATRRITFEIDVTSATLDGSSETFIEADDFWKRVKQAKNEDLKLFETAPTGRNGRSSRQLGSIEEVDADSSIIRVRLERDLAEYVTQGRYQLPAKGFLFFQARGEITQIERKKQALKDLNHGRTQNPYLGNFLFDAKQARPIETIVQLQPQELLLSSANPSQRRAVEAVLAAPDLVLIQGPPGTGKTTVIAEICYQVARRGGRTLIASQANLAVDNALSRLIHNPVIRAVRKGNATSVGEEGLPFLEDRVIGTWLQNTANDCEKSLNGRLDNVQVFRQLLASSERFTAYLKAEVILEQQLHRTTNLESICLNQTSVHAEAKAVLRPVLALDSELDTLLASKLSVNWHDPSVIDLLARLQPYAARDKSVRNFIANVQVTATLATELGLSRPACETFGLAAWLQDTVAAWISETQTAIAYANDSVTAMTEAESSAKTFTQNSDSLVRLREEHQKLFADKYCFQQKIETLQNRKSQISIAASELETWLPSARSSIWNALTKCLQERQDFKTDLISLPSELLALTSEERSLPWHQSQNQCQIRVNKLIAKYREWDRISTLASELKGLLSQSSKALATQSPSEGAIFRATNALRTDTQNPVSALEKLILSARSSIIEIKMPLGFWGRMLEWLLTKASQIKILEPIVEKLHKYNSHLKAAIKLHAAAKLYAIRKQAQAIVQKAQLGDYKLDLDSIATEVINGIATSARTWLNQLQAHTEQELQNIEEQLNNLQRLEAKQQLQISTTQEGIETYRSEADIMFRRVIAFLQDLARTPQLPKELQILVKQYLHTPSDILAQKSELLSKVHSWASRTEKLKTLISSLDTFAALLTIKNAIQIEVSACQNTTDQALKQLTDSQIQLREQKTQLQQQLENITIERSWWQSAFSAIPERLKPTISATNLFSPEFLRQVEPQFNVWQQELAQEEAYLGRYQHLVSDWISRLRNPSEQDHNELRRIYLDNANVIGITCVQAARPDFSEEFKAFDVVIIDEVSKCTPPELLIPALKGKKLVMVGDHRQLPPMLDTSSLEEVAQVLGSTRDELQFLENSLFKSQFETADESLKQMLDIQYRMHPDIMGAINQFYEHKLQCGIVEPDLKRAHNLAGATIQEKHHIIWTPTPVEQGFEEQREGTSFFNLREIDIIERLCQQMEDAWADKVAKGEPKKEIAIITFYGGQLRRIDRRLDSKAFPSLHIRTGTVDRFQGMERPVVIVSMVRNNRQRDVGFAKKSERVNVAFSRAQELLAIVGCHDLFTQQAGKAGNMYLNVSNVVRRHEGFIDVSRLLC